MQLMLSELEQLRADYKYLEARHEKLRSILSHLLPEKTGAYFITGQMGMVDSAGLPDTILVCPSHGVDWVCSYEKKEASGPGY